MSSNIASHSSHGRNDLTSTVEEEKKQKNDEKEIISEEKVEDRSAVATTNSPMDIEEKGEKEPIKKEVLEDEKNCAGGPSAVQKTQTKAKKKYTSVHSLSPLTKFQNKKRKKSQFKSSKKSKPLRKYALRKGTTYTTTFTGITNKDTTNKDATTCPLHDSDGDDVPLTQDEKNKLGADILKLPREKILSLFQMIRRREPQINNFALDIDLDKVKLSTARAVEKYVKSALEEMQSTSSSTNVELKDSATGAMSDTDSSCSSFNDPETENNSLTNSTDEDE